MRVKRKKRRERGIKGVCLLFVSIVDPLYYHRDANDKCCTDEQENRIRFE